MLRFTVRKWCTGRVFYSGTDMPVCGKFLRELYRLIGESPATLIASVVRKEGWSLSGREAREAIESVAYGCLLEGVSLFFDKINCDEGVLLVVGEVDVGRGVGV